MGVHLIVSAFYHKLSDLGAFTVDQDLRVLVSQFLAGLGREAAIGRYGGERIYAPAGLDVRYRPGPEYLDWHRNQVFKAYR